MSEYWANLTLLYRQAQTELWNIKKQRNDYPWTSTLKKEKKKTENKNLHPSPWLREKMLEVFRALV